MTERRSPGSNPAYRGPAAWTYDRVWRGYTERSLRQTLALVDWPWLEGAGSPTLVDAGCGTGRLLELLAARLPGAQLAGVDAVVDMLAVAQRRLGGRAGLVAGALGRGSLPLRAGCAELVALTSVLHYTADPAATLAELARLAQPGGQVLVQDFGPRRPRRLWDAFERLLRTVDRGHVRAYRLEEVVAACAAAGLLVERSEAFAIGWWWRGWALRARTKATASAASATAWRCIPRWRRFWSST